MIRWRKARTVATFEFLSEIKRISYLIGVFGMPLFLMAYAGFVSLIGTITKRSESKVRIYGLVDHTGSLGLENEITRPGIEVPAEIEEVLRKIGRQGSMPSPALWAGNVVFRPYPDEGSAMTALKERTITGWFLLPVDYMATGQVDSYYAEDALGSRDVERSLRDILQDRLLTGRVNEELAERIRNPLRRGKSWIVKPGGVLAPRSALSIIARLGVPIVFSILLFISVFGTSMTLIQGTAVEKENKVVEVLLSSATPDEILAGKLLGLGGAGLLQISVWFSMAGLGGLLFAGALAAMGVEIPWGAIAAGLVFFVTGYLFLGSLMLGTGSLGSNAKEGQQWSIVWTLMSAIPLAMLGIIINDTHGPVARFLTWFPFSSPTMVVFRLSVDPDAIAWWEVAGSLLLLMLCTWGALRFGARLFRVGLLMGGRPRLKEILRQARLSA